MFLDAAAAIVSADKLRDYLLSSAHPIGRYKSTFFRSLGYAPEQWQVLERDLRGVLSNEANGRSAGIVSIWIILLGEKAPRFVTAYPEE